MRIVVAGGTGLLGSALSDELRREGHTVTILTRRPGQSHHVRWDPYGSITGWAPVLEDADAVINLAGAPIGRRWNAAHKREIWNSRVRATRTLVSALKSVRRIPPTFISASAIGIYGPRGDEPLTEDSRPGSGFLAGLSAEWEKEALTAGPQSRVVLVRTGLVLDRRAGALPRIAQPFQFFVGGPLGSGRQYMSWIHRDDWTALVRWAIGNAAVAGPLNATAPNPVTNLEFARTLGAVLHRPALVPAPAFALRLVLGEMAETALTGQRVFPEQAHARGFEFRHPALEPALRALYAAA
ncbi:MAG: TIGR01777 family protein [Acidobacteria bacterium]|nr:TIGR01777 family protein [Acidobacteriota bacterium]